MSNRIRRRHGLQVELLEDRTLLTGSANAAPVLSLPQTSFAVVKTSTLSVLASATDRDRNQTLIFSLVGAPAGATITSMQVPSATGSAAIGTLAWTPDEDQGPASYSFTVKVTDNGNPVRSATKTITIATRAVGLVGNDLWIIGTSANKGTATNPGDDVAAVSATNLPNKVSVAINGANSTFTIPTGGKILTRLFGGDDHFTLNEGTGACLIAPALSLDTGTGTNTLIVNGTPGPDAFTITATTVSLAGAGTLDYANVQSLLVNGLGGIDTFAMTGINASTVTALDGGADTDSFSGTFAADFTGSLTLLCMDSATLSVAGTVSAGSSITGTDFTNVSLDTLAGTLLADGGSITGATITTIAAGGLLHAKETIAETAGVLSLANVGTVAGSVLAGAIVNCTFDFVAPGGTVTAQGQGTTTDVTIGNLDGTFTAVEDQNFGSGVMSDTYIFKLGPTGEVLAGHISGMTVETGDEGSSIIAAGQGTTSDVTFGNFDGLFMALEDENAGSGVMSDTTIFKLGPNGEVFAGHISGMFVETADEGSSIIAAGQGTTSDVTFGNFDGLFMALEDENAGSGVMSDTTIFKLGPNGEVFAGSISGMTVETTDEGSSILAAGQGTTSDVTIGTLNGSFEAREDSNPGSGVMSDTVIEKIGPTGEVLAGAISGMTVETTDEGSSIIAAGQGTTSDVTIGTLNGEFMALEDSNPGSGVMSDTFILKIGPTGEVFAGAISGMTVETTDEGSSIIAAGQGTIINITIEIHAGSLTAMKDDMPGSGSLINGNFGTLTITGVISADTADNLSITTFTGTVDVTNTLANFSVGTFVGAASLTAGQFLTFTARHVAPLIQFIESTVTRTVAATPHIPGGGMPDFGIYYDGTGSGNPRVVVNFNAAAVGNFDLAVTTSTATDGGAGFDLAGVYSTDNNQTGINNLVVGGNLLLGEVPAGAIAFFGLPPDTTGGVQLPNDIVAVAVAGDLPAASILAMSVPALTAHSFAGVEADSAGIPNAQATLAAGTALSKANGDFQVFFSEAGNVAQFLVTGNAGSFDGKKMLFSDIVMDNAPVTAQVTLIPIGTSTSVDVVAFAGQGASLKTAQPIISMISAIGGSIGDLTLSSPYGLANITADSIIGNIDVSNGPIHGVVQATVGDLGRPFTDAAGKITCVTTIQAEGLSGKILANGNLVSQINLECGLDGVVATNGDIGIIQTTNGVADLNPNGSLIRFGGIVVWTGGVDGQVIALGNAFGDILVFGGLSGRIAVKGNPGEFGLAPFRFGILGNVWIIGGIKTTGAIVSSGLIGDDGANNIPNDIKGTHLLVLGWERGIIAAGEDINFAWGCGLSSGVFENATGSNQDAIDWIFTNEGDLLDVLDPAQLNLIIQDLLALRISAGTLTGTTP